MDRKPPGSGGNTLFVQRETESVEEEEKEGIRTKPFSFGATPRFQRQIETDEIETDEIETDEIETDEIETDEIETDEIEEGAGENEEDTLRTQKNPGSLSRGLSSPEPPVQDLKGKGVPLSGALRDYYEPRFGYDFGGVRVHTTPEASESSRALNALAFTSGQDIAFAKGRYSPDTSEGKRLLAHELTHVVQQGGGRSTGSRSMRRASSDLFTQRG